MKKVVMIGVVVVVVAATAIIVFVRSRQSAEGPRYQKLSVSRQTIDLKVQSTGDVQAQNRLAIKPPVAGRIETVLVNEGQWLQKGRTIAWMSSTERVALIDAARGRGEEELKKWNELYKATPIIAPMNGLLIVRGVEPGQTLTTVDTAFVMSDRLIVMSDVDETDIGHIGLGQPATITLDAYPDQKLTGKVIQIAFDSKTVNNVTVYEVKVQPDSVPRFMKSGMTASVVFFVDKRENVLALPAEAIQRDDNSKFVLLANPGGKAPPERCSIETGLSNGKLVEVTSGLSENDEVMIRVSRPVAASQKQSNPFMPMRGGGGKGR